MIKKMICFFLVFTLSIITTSVSAVSEEKTVTECSIQVNFGGVLFQQNVIKTQEDQILVPVSWLHYFAAMQTSVEDGYYKFTYAGQEELSTFAKRVMIKEDGTSFDIRYYVDEFDENPQKDKFAEIERVWQEIVFKNLKDELGLKKFGTERKWSFSVLSGNFSDQMYYKECLYLPIAELLPLMNADIAFSNEGQVLINLHCVSLSQALYDVQIDTLRFDAVNDMKYKGVSYGKGLGGAGYIVDSLLNFRIDRLDFICNSGSVSDYQSLFKSYLTDNEVYLSSFDLELSPQAKQFSFMDEAVGSGTTALKTLDKGFNWIQSMEFSKEIYPDTYDIFFEDFTHTKIKGVAVVENGADIVEGFGKCFSYMNTYANQVGDHREMLSAVFDYQVTKKLESSPSYKAAQLTAAIYGTDYASKAVGLAATGLREKAWDMVENTFIDGVVAPYKITTTFLKIGLSEEFKVVENTGLINHMDAVVEKAYSVFSSRSLTDCSTEGLNNLRLSAIMTLIASRHAYTSLWDENYEKIKDIDEALVKLYLAADGVECDSSDYYGKKKAELEKELKGIKTKDGWNVPLVSNVDVDLIQYIDVEGDPYDFFFFKKDEKYGAIDKNGNIIIPAEYDGISTSSERLNSNGEWDSDQETVHLYDVDLAQSSKGYSGYWVERDGTLTKGGLFGRGGDGWTEIYWDQKNDNAHVFELALGAELIDDYVYSYEKYSKDFSPKHSFDFIQSLKEWNLGGWNGFCFEPVLASEKYGLFDVKTGTMVTDFVFDDYFIINEQIAMVSANGNWRLVDQKGNYINDCVYDDPKTFDQDDFGYDYRAFYGFNGYVVVKANGKYGLLDSEGKQILEPTFKNISHVSPDGLYWVQSETGTWDLMQVNYVSF